MEKFRAISSRVVPIPIKDVDTDMIIPAQFLTSIDSSGYGENLFRRLRDADSNFSLNKPEFQGAEIMVADSNFGCGSSREHAVWALTGWGIRVVIAKSFADIFASNSAKNGLLLVVLQERIVESLLQQAESGKLVLHVDLEQQRVTLPGGIVEEFSYDPFRKHCLLQGLDDLDYILSYQNEIDCFRAEQLPRTFFNTTTPNR
jgi:3-isopropylmalate/(R)-2-methylmalate dehydratase small subunit